MKASIKKVSSLISLSCCLLMSTVTGLWAQEVTTSSLLQQAQTHMLSFDYAAAIPLLLELVKEDSAALHPHWLLGQSYSQLGQTAAAKQQLQLLVRLEPGYKAAWALLGQLYLRETNFVAAANSYDQLLALDTTNAYYYKQRAFTAEKTGDIPAAVYHYERALQLSARDLESLASLAELKLKLGEFAVSKELLEQGLQQDSANLRLSRLQAKLAYKQKDYAQVVQAMQYPLAAGDTTGYYLQLLGISHFHLSNYPEALRRLHYLQQQGVDTEVLYYYIGLSYRNSGQIAKGIQFLEKAALKGVSDNLDHYYTQLAVTYEEKGDLANAIKAYQAAYRSSKDHLLLYHLARNYDRFYKDKRVALNYYERFLTEVDTVNKNYQDYARYRASQLKEHIHFEADTL